MKLNVEKRGLNSILSYFRKEVLLFQKVYLFPLILSLGLGNALFAQSFSPMQHWNPPTTSTNVNWNFNMGYRFNTQLDGTITALGGKWRSGVTHTVRLYAYPAGTLLASVNVLGDGSWKYANLTSAVTVTKGNQYVVAVRLNSQSSGEYSSGLSYPYYHVGIEIEGSCFLSNSNAMPTNLNTTNSYGHADIIFQPCSYAGEISSLKEAVIEGGATVLSLSNAIGSIKWQKSTDNVNFQDIPGQFGNQLNTGPLQVKTFYRTVVASGNCFDTSKVHSVSIIDPNYSLQALDLDIVAEDVNWNFNMGYRFRPTKDGQITELGGRWRDGVSHVVRLYQVTGGNVLASATIVGSKNWKYQAITPVNVSAGTEYVVAVRLNSQTSGLYSNVSLPRTSGNVEILSSVYRSGSDLIPNVAVTNRMYGEADIRFVPCVSAGVVVAKDDPVLINNATQLYAAGNSSTVTWQSSSDGVNFSTLSTGDTLTTGQLSQTTYYRTLVSGSCANDTSEVFELKVFDPSYILQGAKPVTTLENVNWDYNMGYRFTANINGTVDELGGRWANGVSHTVRLYSYPSGTVLASVNVTGSGTQWAYASISPVSLTAGNEYVVAVRLTNNNSGVYGTIPGGMPYTANYITITSSMFRASSNAIPNSNSNTTMYGWADLKFTPCVRSGEVFAADTVACVNDTIQLELKYGIGNIQWQSSTDGVNYSNITGAIDSVYTINGIQNSAFYRAILSSACGADTSHPQLITVSGSGQIGLWTGEVDDDWFNACNWADGSVPVNGDSAIFIPGTNMPSNMPTINLRFLSLNNSLGLNLSNRLRINDSLNLINGQITLNNSNLVLGPNARIGTNFSASYIVTNGNGRVRLIYSAAGGGERVVPIGDANAFTPCTIDLTAASSLNAGAYIAVRSLSGMDPNANAPLNYLSRRWEVSVNGITGAVYNARFTYDDGEVLGAEAALRLQLFSGGTWTQFSAPNTTSNVFQVSGINQFGSFTGFDKEGIETVQSGNWNAGSTWLGGVVPDTSDQAIIKATHTVTLNSNTFAGGITIESGASLDIQTNTLHIRSNFKNDGTFTGSGTLRLVGNALQSLSGNSNTQLEILEINNPQGVVINSGEIAIGTRLDIISGNLNTNGRITLLSSSSRTANLGQVLGSLSGSIKAQRHINGLGNDVGWRHLCSPVQSSALSDFKYHPTTYPKGIYFYGFSGSNQNYNWANAYSFSESSAGLSGNFDNGWIAANNISNPISFTTPYTIYTGGVNFPEYDLEVEGIPNVGNQLISGLSLTGTSRWHLIGNPYPSSIDWSAVARTGIDAIAYVFSETNGGYIATNLLPNPNLIASFQAFFVRVNNATNSLTFQENDKVNTDAPFQKSFKNGDRMLMRLTNTRTKRFSPAAVDWIADASPAFDSEYDAYKLYNGYPMPNLGLIPAGDTTELQVAADAPGKAVYSYAIRVLTPLTDSMDLLFEDLPSSKEYCLRLYDKDLDSTMTVSKGFVYRFLLRDTANYARFELSAFDVSASASIDHISCYGAADGGLTLELPQWTAFNVRWYDGQGGLIKQSFNVNGSDSLAALLPGSYAVSLNDVKGMCPVFDKNFSIFEPQEVIADFELSADSLVVGDTLYISNRSQGAGSFYWSFGDGTVDSSTNPMHVYQWAGEFDLALLSYENSCSDTISRHVKVVQRPLSDGGVDKIQDYRIKLKTNSLIISDLSQDSHNIALYDMRGTLIFSDAFEGPSYFKEGLSIVPGTYTINLDSDFIKLLSQ